MFGLRFKSWMESHIVRPRKKQQQGNKDGKGKNKPIAETEAHAPASPKKVEARAGQHVLCPLLSQHAAQTQPAGQNLSSPESAYSTGYSTDGTSPGASFPPEYYINLRSGTHYFHPAAQEVNLRIKPNTCIKQISVIERHNSHRRTESCDESRRSIRTSIVQVEETSRSPQIPLRHPPVAPGQLTASPRQRNRIRTNPWLKPPGESSSGSDVTLPRKHEASSHSSHPTSWSRSPCSSSSTSTCSSRTLSEEDDATLNEMLGKFDESYIYEKETDILSDSDATDVEEDFDTGQDADADAEEEEELDFIDNGSCLDLDPNDDGDVNKGHCTYHMPLIEMARKNTNRHRESFLRRSSLRRHGTKDEATGSPVASKHQSLQNRRNSSSRHRRHQENTPRNASDKKRVRPPMKRNCSVKDHSNTSLKPPPVIPHVNGLNKVEWHDVEMGAVNLNRVLMQKILARNSLSGTRSAGNTPVSLRKRILSNDDQGRTKRVLSPSKLAQAESNNSLTNCSSVPKIFSGPAPGSPTNSDTYKKRSHSISYGIKVNEIKVSVGTVGNLGNYSSELALIEADKEAERKYKELIKEAEHLLISMKGNIPEKGSGFLLPKPKPFFLNSKYLMDDCVRNKVQNQTKSTGSVPGSPCHQLKPASPLHRAKSPLPLHVLKEINQNSKHFERLDLTDTSLHKNPVNLYKNMQENNFQEQFKYCSPRTEDKNSHIRAQKNSPQKKKVPVQNGFSSSQSFSSSDSDGSTTPNCEESSVPRKSTTAISLKTHQHKRDSNTIPMSKNISSVRASGGADVIRMTIGQENSLLDSTPVPHIPSSFSTNFQQLPAFRSLDLGNSSGYCPQSEPLKRKVYACSSTFDKLQRSLEKSQHTSLKHKPNSNKMEDEKSSRETLREKLENLRRERLEVEAKVREAQEEDRKRMDDKNCSLSLFRRQILVHTIEGLKRSLEDQSAALQETLQPENSTEEMAEK